MKIYLFFIERVNSKQKETISEECLQHKPKLEVTVTSSFQLTNMYVSLTISLADQDILMEKTLVSLDFQAST